MENGTYRYNIPFCTGMYRYISVHTPIGVYRCTASYSFYKVMKIKMNTIEFLGMTNGWKDALHCWRQFLARPLQIEDARPAWISIQVVGFVFFFKAPGTRARRFRKEWRAWQQKKRLLG